MHSKKLLPEYKNIEYIAYPLAKKNYLFRCFYEYIYFYFLSKKLKPKFWLSLHDMTPITDCAYRYVYMHNPSPFYKKQKGDMLSLKFRLFMKFYKYVYRINVKKNTYVIVQQNWLRDDMANLCKIPKGKILVAYPEIQERKIASSFEKNLFFFPSYPREFKNFEVICRATDLLVSDETITEAWNVVLTIDGTENTYSKNIVERYKTNSHIKFVGVLNSEQMQEMYNRTECLIFPSKLETWGLPISEFKVSGKKMLLADLPYAHETANGAAYASFFSPTDEHELAGYMKGIIKGETAEFSIVNTEVPNYPFCKSWEELLSLLKAPNL